MWIDIQPMKLGETAALQTSRNQDTSLRPKNC